MTTEIAVINRLGVALAADSAITVSGFGPDKVFDTGDKLFELSCVHPVAAMVNGNMNFLGVPWEVIIKGFRDEAPDQQHDSIELWAASLINYIENHRAIRPEYVAEWLDQFINTAITNLQRSVMSRGQEMLQEIADPNDLRLQIQQLLGEGIGELAALAEQLPILPSLHGTDRAAWRAQLQPQLQVIQAESFGGHGPAPDDAEKLCTAIADLSLSFIDPQRSTGIVISGFGRDKLFPYLWAVSIDGVLDGKLRYQVTHRVEISRSSTEEDGGPNKELGTAISFAQTDVIERLLRGADARFIDKTKDFITNTVRDAISQTFTANSLRILSDTDEVVDFDRLAEVVAGALPDLYEAYAATEIGDNIEREFKRTIALMPKQELIELAEALVSITAVERKATRDTGTVGGPVDVALITRSEGFVWVKRKHHFSADLNPRYVSRVQGRAAGARRNP